MAYFSKRLLNENKQMQREKENLARQSRIYWDWGETDTDLTKAKAMIIGPEDTPYENGFFFFDVSFPSTYPEQPPQVTFKTTDCRARLHPNLYVEGKVCLSVLGTWPGPGWTMSMTLRAVLITIQSLMSTHPITSEPAYEKSAGTKLDTLYSKIVKYENINVAIIRMLKNCPEGFHGFLPVMKRCFLDNYDKTFASLKEYETEEGKSESAPCYNYQCKYEVARLLKDLEELKRAISKEEGDVKCVAPPTVSPSPNESSTTTVASASSASASSSSSSGGVVGTKRASESAADCSISDEPAVKCAKNDA